MTSQGSRNKAKGSRVEREFAARFTKAGVPTRRVVGSGAHARYDKRLEGDLQIGVRGSSYRLVGEVKARKSGSGFITLEKWLGSNDLLLLKRNHAEPLVCMELDKFLPMLRAWWDMNNGENI